ncbi:tryptophan--tRNA ligase [Sphingorhabdus sp.]|uniref:tryptophan--tRNA ligase n=1 Tax=Sphingorhabdus sp. TaxID=1902408 RepID=UPI0032B84FB6
MTQATYLSGIQATGVPHIGNYVGAISQWIRTQDSDDRSFYMIADLHAITTPPEPEVLRRNRFGAMAGLLACGLDPKHAVLFFQSTVPEHTELSWLLSSLSYMGELRRMTQFKAKSKENQEGASMALFGYPVLQAADILIYQANFVPVGADQLQHIELTRDIAGRFNAKYGETFVIPKATVPKIGARIMDLQYPDRKMSKSGIDSVQGTIFLDDEDDAIRRKISKSVTDSLNRIVYSDEQPGLRNLIDLYSALTGGTPAGVVEQFEGQGYGNLKKELTDVIVATIAPVRTEINRLTGDQVELERLVATCSATAREQATATLRKAKLAMGF